MECSTAGLAKTLDSSSSQQFSSKDRHVPLHSWQAQHPASSIACAANSRHRGNCGSGRHAHQQRVHSPTTYIYFPPSTTTLQPGRAGQNPRHHLIITVLMTSACPGARSCLVDEGPSIQARRCRTETPGVCVCMQTCCFKVRGRKTDIVQLA